MQTTLQRSVEFSGVGLHTGLPCRTVIRPAKENTGLIFSRADYELPDDSAKRIHLIAASPENVVTANHGTKLANAHGAEVGTVEHLMAAFALCGVDNALIEVIGPEIPILDGSSSPFFIAINNAGLKKQPTAPRRVIAPDQNVTIGDDERFIRFEPADAFILNVSIDFDDCMIGRQSISLAVDDGREQRRLANARTFCRIGEVESLQRAGLIRGGSLENSLVVDGLNLLNDEKLRDPQEFVLHKALDLLGDLYLLGAPIRAIVTAEKPGHDLNVRAARALAGAPQAVAAQQAQDAAIAVSA